MNNNKIYEILQPEYAIRFINQDYPILIGNDDNENGYYFEEDCINDEGLINEPRIYDFENNEFDLTIGLFLIYN